MAVGKQKQRATWFLPLKKWLSSQALT